METILPFLIFLARTTDVSLGTVRTIFIYRGKKYLVFLLGFVEILIWVLAINAVLKHLSHWVNVVAYAGGFAMGNFVGIWIEEKLAIGRVLVRIFAVSEVKALKDLFRQKGYGITIIDAKGQEGPVSILYTIINREDYPFLAQKIQEISPKTFYTVEDIRMTKAGIFPRGK